jgi:hypothetical protein
MSASDVGRTNFTDGMRVTREHLDHLQDTLRIAADVARRNAGPGKVCFGLKVDGLGADGVTISAGAAVDRNARVLIAKAQTFKVPASPASQHLVLNHVLRPGEDMFQDAPTMTFDDSEVQARPQAPPYDDDAVAFARVELGGDVVEVFQLGEWFTPPQDHTHSGAFLMRDGLWRYDGHPLGYPPARFDSGFVPVGRGVTITLAHGFGAADLVVELQAKRKDGVITSAGLGTTHWYELAPGEIRVACADTKAAAGLELRAMIWPLGAAEGGPLLPLANTGSTVVVEPGADFVLDASDSRAFGGKKLKQFTWTQIN